VKTPIAAILSATAGFVSREHVTRLWSSLGSSEMPPVSEPESGMLRPFLVIDAEPNLSVPYIRSNGPGEYVVRRVCRKCT